MPLRATELDTGFSGYLPEQRPEVKPTEHIRTLENIGDILTGDTRGMSQAMGETWDTLKAGFQMESAPLAVLDLLTRPQFKADPSFDTEARLKADGLWNDYSDLFVGVQSEQEYLAISGRMAQEEKNRKTLEAAGLPGFAVQMAAGLLDPTVLLPFVGGLKGAKAIGMGLTMGAVGSAAQEIPLQLAQETRSMNESVSTIAMGTVLGGVLGGAVAWSRRGLTEVGDDLIRFQNNDMALERGGTAIPSPASLGAASAAGPVPELLRMSPLPKAIDPLWDAVFTPMTHAIGNLTIPNAVQNVPLLGRVAGKTLGELTPGNITRIFPTVYNLTARFKAGKYMTAKLSDSGLEIKGAAPGGTVENLIRGWDAPIGEARDRLGLAYSKYLYGQQAGGKFGNRTKAAMVGLTGTGDRLSFQQFRQQVGRAMRQGDKHELPEVAEMATYLRSSIYDPLFLEAKKVGMFKDLDEEVLGDSSYLNRVYDIDVIIARKPEFIGKLAKHFNEKLTREFREQAAKLLDRQAKLTERAEDFARPLDEVVALRKKFQEDLEALEGGRNAELVELEDAISDKRSVARTLDRGTPDREAALAEARALESEGGEALGEVKAERARIKRRLRNLTRAHSALTERQQAKLDKIATAEDNSFGTLQRFAKKAAKILAEFEKTTDDVLDAEVRKLQGQFAETAAKYDRNEERVAKVFESEFVADEPTSPFLQVARTETEAFDKMSDIANRIGDAEDLDREALRDLVQQAFDEATKRAQSIVERRAVRNARLAEQAADLDPDKALERVNGLKQEMKTISREFEDSWRVRGADSLDPTTGVADFRKYAEEMAEAAADRILKTNMRLPGVDMLMNPKEAELARTLDIDSNSLLSDEDGMSFLVDDVDELINRYNRTLAPDIELHRAFGEFATDMEKNENFLRLRDEVKAEVERITADMKAGINPETGRKMGRPYTQKQIDLKNKEVQAEAAQVRENLMAMIDRARYQRGLPKEPTSLGARAGNIARNLNVTRFMGGVSVSSVADVGRPVMKHGIIRTVNQGYIPFIKRLTSGAMLRDGISDRHLRATGAGWDMATQGRNEQIMGSGDYLRGGSKFEKGLEFISSRMGNIAAFAPWTDIGKQISGAITNARLMDSLAVVAGGEKASAKELQEAINYLAAGGIDADLASTIWRQTEKEGGADLVDGQWWGNTEVWDKDAARAYNQFIYRDTANTIITPGIDMPLFMDANPVMKLLTQFKSFGMTSTTRALMAGLQQRDMAFYTGTMISLALGGVSYYTYANIVGGRILEEMLQDIREGNFNKFADEAISRSGLLGFGSDLQSIGAALPYLNDKVTFSGKRTTRQGGSNLLETLAGPTFGDLANTVSNVATGAVDPTRGTVHQFRTLVPLQNHSILRRIFDQVEAAATANLPERRQ